MKLRDRLALRAELLDEINQHPDMHLHTFQELLQCTRIDGALDLAVMEAHRGVVKPGALCDCTQGPCACGAHH